MAAGLPTSVRWEGGRLVAAPTSLAGAYPYGGAELGLVKELYLQPALDSLFITAEEYGGVVTEIGVGTDDVIAGFIGRGWDKDLLALQPGGSAAGGGSVKRNVLTDAHGAGRLRTGFKLLFVPDDRVNGIFYLLVSGVLMPQATAKAQQSYNREFGVPYIVWGTPHADGRILEHGPLSEIVL